MPYISYNENGIWLALLLQIAKANTKCFIRYNKKKVKQWWSPIPLISIQLAICSQLKSPTTKNSTTFGGVKRATAPPPPLSLSPMWKQDTTLTACRNIIYDHINKNNKLYETKWSRKPIIFSTVSVYPLAKNCLDSSAFLFKKTF